MSILNPKMQSLHLSPPPLLDYSTEWTAPTLVLRGGRALIVMLRISSVFDCFNLFALIPFERNPIMKFILLKLRYKP